MNPLIDLAKACIKSKKAFSLNNLMSQDQKRDAIIEAAIKRFAHFGVAKTTMTEIATDLSISKALLYYYFPDKLSLYAEVLKTIINTASDKDSSIINNEADPHLAIQIFLERRTDFIIRYHNILEYLKSISPSQSEELKSLFTFFRNHELQRIVAIIEKGRIAHQFKIEDAQKTGELYFDCLQGLRISILSLNTSLFPDKKQFQAILKKEKQFTAIFFNGLTC